MERLTPFRNLSSLHRATIAVEYTKSPIPTLRGQKRRKLQTVNKMNEPNKKAVSNQMRKSVLKRTRVWQPATDVKPESNTHHPPSLGCHVVAELPPDCLLRRTAPRLRRAGRLRLCHRALCHPGSLGTWRRHGGHVPLGQRWCVPAASHPVLPLGVPAGDQARGREEEARRNRRAGAAGPTAAYGRTGKQEAPAD